MSASGPERPGDATGQDDTEFPDRPRGRHVAWVDEDEELDDLDDAPASGGGPADGVDVAASDDSLAPGEDAAGPGDDSDDDDEDADDEDADDDGDDEDEDDEDDEGAFSGEDEVDFGVIAYREDGRWHAEPLPAEAIETWEGFRTAVLARSRESGVLGFASLDESALVVLRPTGAGERVVLSDIETADYLLFSDDLVEHLRRTDPSIDDVIEATDFGDSEDPVPIGDLGLLSDLGLAADDLRELCEDLGSEPEDLLEEIGEALRIGGVLGDAVDSATA